MTTGYLLISRSCLLIQEMNDKSPVPLMGIGLTKNQLFTQLMSVNLLTTNLDFTYSSILEAIYARSVISILLSLFISAIFAAAQPASPELLPKW
ncbi:hypothetical protein D3C86_1195480 [compost metagenome]